MRLRLIQTKQNSDTETLNQIVLISVLNIDIWRQQIIFILGPRAEIQSFSNIHALFSWRMFWKQEGGCISDPVSEVLKRKMVLDQKLYWLKIQIYCQYSLIQFLYITNNHPCCLWTLIIMWFMPIFNQQFLSKHYNFSNYFLIIGNKVAEDLTFVDSCLFNLKLRHAIQNAWVAPS